GGVADAQEDRLSFRPGLSQRLLAPRVPIDRIVRVLQQIRTRLIDQPVRHPRPPLAPWPQVGKALRVYGSRPTGRAHPSFRLRPWQIWDRRGVYSPCCFSLAPCPSTVLPSAGVIPAPRREGAGRWSTASGRTRSRRSWGGAAW